LFEIDKCFPELASKNQLFRSCSHFIVVVIVVY
jgi:hypothetical protein